MEFQSTRDDSFTSSYRCYNGMDSRQVEVCRDSTKARLGYRSIDEVAIRSPIGGVVIEEPSTALPFCY